jgi:hypothetical protein
LEELSLDPLPLVEALLLLPLQWHREVSLVELLLGRPLLVGELPLLLLPPQLEVFLAELRLGLHRLVGVGLLPPLQPQLEVFLGEEREVFLVEGNFLVRRCVLKSILYRVNSAFSVLTVEFNFVHFGITSSRLMIIDNRITFKFSV